MMTEYLEGMIPGMDILKKTLRKAVIDNAIFPVFAGSALKNKGVQLILDAVIDYLPAPTDIASVKGVDPKNEDVFIERHASDKEPFSEACLSMTTSSLFGSTPLTEAMSEG